VKKAKEDENFFFQSFFFTIRHSFSAVLCPGISSGREKARENDIFFRAPVLQSGISVV
jgi:hypothetical protein